MKTVCVLRQRTARILHCEVTETTFSCLDRYLQQASQLQDDTFTQTMWCRVVTMSCMHDTPLLAGFTPRATIYIFLGQPSKYS